MKEDYHIGMPILIIEIHNTKGGTMKVELKPEDLKTTKNGKSLLIGREYS